MWTISSWWCYIGCQHESDPSGFMIAMLISPKVIYVDVSFFVSAMCLLASLQFKSVINFAHCTVSFNNSSPWMTSLFDRAWLCRMIFVHSMMPSDRLPHPTGAEFLLLNKSCVTSKVFMVNWWKKFLSNTMLLISPSTGWNLSSPRFISHERNFSGPVIE